jgi:hypothetical protein
MGEPGVAAARGDQRKFRGEFACRPGIAAGYRDDKMQPSGLAATVLQ